jgi:hypothetical protein
VRSVHDRGRLRASSRSLPITQNNQIHDLGPKKVVESALCPDPVDVDEEEWKCGSPAIGDRRVILARQGLRHGESHYKGL